MQAQREARAPNADGSIPYYPVMLDLRERLAVIIGGGEVAEQKARSLVEARARVRVVSPVLTPGLESLVTQSAVEVVRRPYETGDLRGASIAIAAADNRGVNAAVWREAEAEGVPLNAVDDVEHCHFIAPSVHREGDVTVAVSTAGTCPTLAVRLRQRIGRFIGREHAEFAHLAGELRAGINRRVPDPASRRALWYSIVDSDAIEALRDGRRDAALDTIERAVRTAEARGALRPPAASPVETARYVAEGDRGIVYIVGAGPGDPGLITVRGLRLLCAADVIVHDGLVDPALLMHAQPRARLVNVAKRGHGACTTQATINQFLVTEARCGRTVVRLKGGDPFVFGRAAQEIGALRAAGVRYEVVPGVSSAIAAPAAAGIPVTSREVSAGFAVVTAREVNGGLHDADAGTLDWGALARLPTLVVMMGLRALPAVVARLREAGRAGDTPAAVISKATLPEQRVVVGTLASIANDVTAAQLAQPATLVVGHVVLLRPPE